MQENIADSEWPDEIKNIKARPRIPILENYLSNPKGKFILTNESGHFEDIPTSETWESFRTSYPRTAGLMKLLGIGPEKN